MNMILGYVGYACSGKDTASKLLEKLIIECSNSAVKLEDPTTLITGTLVDERLIIWHVPLALGVKLEFVEEQNKLGISVDLRKLLYDSEYKCQFRKQLIEIGDGRRNTVHPLYWIHKAQENIKHLLQQYPDQQHIFQITDMRYQNEIPEFENYAYANNISMLSIKVEASLHLILARMAKPGVIDYMQRHRLNNSEINVKRIAADIVLNNNNSTRQLEKDIKVQVLPIMGLILYENEQKFTRRFTLKWLLTGLASLWNACLSRV
jgi:dephospho-CoA kinase